MDIISGLVLIYMFYRHFKSKQTNQKVLVVNSRLKIFIVYIIIAFVTALLVYIFEPSTTLSFVVFMKTIGFTLLLYWLISILTIDFIANK